MEQKINAWKANLSSGLILGMAGIVYTLVIYFLDMTFNKSMGYIFLLVAIFLVYFLIKSYRDNYLHGIITYGQAVGAGVIIFLYHSILAAIFTYLLYKVIDPALPAKMIAFIEETMLEKGIPEASLDTVMAIQKKIFKPEIMAPFSIINNMLFGTVISLIIGVFVRKEGNPLIEPAEK
jgi:hypothetical protein